MEMNIEFYLARIFAAFNEATSGQPGVLLISDTIMAFALAAVIIAWRRAVRHVRVLEDENAGLRVDVAVVSTSLECETIWRLRRLSGAQSSALQNQPRDLLELLAKETFGPNRHAAEIAITEEDSLVGDVEGRDNRFAGLANEAP
jgi:hypothetical protein